MLVLARMCIIGTVMMSVMLRGCTVTTGVHVEKDWKTGNEYTSPDLNTKFKIETSKTFGEDHHAPH